MKRLQGAMVWWATIGLLFVSVAVNVVQARRIQSAGAMRSSRAHLGQLALPIAVTDNDGHPLVVRFDQHIPTVVYYFSPSCGWCERNWDNVREIAAHAEGRYRLVAVASEASLASFIDEHRLSFEVYGNVSDETRFALGLTGTPHTIVVSGQGLISHDWAGAFTGSVEHAVEELFHVSLPGLLPSAPGHASHP
jgi:hypothetical protein